MTGPKSFLTEIENLIRKIESLEGINQKLVSDLTVLEYRLDRAKAAFRELTRCKWLATRRKIKQLYDMQEIARAALADLERE